MKGHAQGDCLNWNIELNVARLLGNSSDQPIQVNETNKKKAMTG